MTDERVQALARELLESGVERLGERERRVIGQIARRHHISRNILADSEHGRTLGERWSDNLALWGGSWTFVIGFLIFLLVWATANVVILPAAWQVDPFPFIFLNLLLSMIAAIQAPIILMSQNREAAKDRLRATQDYEVNLKAEIEIMALHDKVDRLVERLDASHPPAKP